MATATAWKFADVKVGDELKPLVLPPISRHQLALYCGGSGDHNPIHVDLDLRQKVRFQGRVRPRHAVDGLPWPPRHQLGPAEAGSWPRHALHLDHLGG